MAANVVTVFGGSGFLGRYVVRELARAGWTIQVVSRHPANAQYLKTAGEVGQIVPVPGNIAQPESYAGRLDGSQAVINLVGILFERGPQNFAAIHANGAEKLAQAARAAGVQSFVHISALGVDRAGGSQYARSKVLGEKAVRAAFPDAVILRPGIIFGPEDNFFNQFAHMAMIAPALPLIGGGHTKFQPVYVGDVARAVVAALTSPDARGKIYELFGPDVFTFRQLLTYILEVIQRKRLQLPLPFGLAELIGLVEETRARLLPIKPPMITRDQVKLLHYDNLPSQDAKTLQDLGVASTPVTAIVPDMLARYASRRAKL